MAMTKTNNNIIDQNTREVITACNDGGQLPYSAILLPFPDMEDYLADELRRRFGYRGKIDWLGCLMCIYDEPSLAAWRNTPPYWALTMMKRPQLTHFSSIKQAASILRAIGRNWAACPTACFRRTALIQDALPHINTKPRPFPTVLPTTPMGLFTLFDDTTMLYSSSTTSCLPCGRLTFVEDHVNPPSRAYLKLQEALTMATSLLGAPLPNSSSVCLDAGAAPGGWTWVLSALGCRVFAIDRAPLAPQLMQNSRVTYLPHDAFTIKPEQAADMGGAHNGYDWVCSDVACYPERLLPWVKQWINSALCGNMVCTIKLKRPEDVDYGLIDEFAAIPRSCVRHLNANKHELTWFAAGGMAQPLHAEH